jgi:hypothetical protein
VGEEGGDVAWMTAAPRRCSVGGGGVVVAEEAGGDEGRDEGEGKVAWSGRCPDLSALLPGGEAGGVF